MEVLTSISIKIKANWAKLIEKLENRGFLNKKCKLSVIARLLTLGPVDIIKYFNRVFSSYLFFFKYLNDLSKTKKRLYWYFKFCLASTFKAKFKFSTRIQVFNSYTNNLKCIDFNGEEIYFITASSSDNLKKSFLTNKFIENTFKRLNQT